jgi:hypothetical protein
MTLSTDIYINQPIDHRKVHARINEILGIADPKISDNPEFDHWEYDENGKPARKVYKGAGSQWTLMNEPGQGFDAWVLVDYRPEGPLVGPEGGHDGDCQLPGNESAWPYAEDGPCTYRRHFPHWVRVNMDTTYGYKDEFGGCSDLHARVILRFGQWLEDQGITDWEWHNEYTGDTYRRFDGLETLGKSGKEADSWFTNTARPAIEAHAQAMGGTLNWAGGPQ